MNQQWIKQIAANSRANAFALAFYGAYFLCTKYKSKHSYCDLDFERYCSIYDVSDWLNELFIIDIPFNSETKQLAVISFCFSVSFVTSTKSKRFLY